MTAIFIIIFSIILVAAYYLLNHKNSNKVISSNVTLATRFYASLVDTIVIFGLYFIVSGIDSYFFWLYPELGIILFIIIGWLYHAIFESSKLQATVGKRTMDIKTIHLSNQRLDFIRATLRFFAKLISFFSIGLGAFQMLIDPNKQTFHDKIIKTQVVHKKSNIDVLKGGAKT